MINNFKNDVNEGLSKVNKTLSSKYFYDKKGDAIFVEIMNMPEYYLTNAEMDIFKNQTQNIIDSLKLQKDTFFELVELGAGDGTKTKQLLQKLDDDGYDFEYVPIDISQNALNQLETTLHKEFPNVNVSKRQGEYFKILSSFKDTKAPKVVLFLGSNIGNLLDDNAKRFVASLSESLNTNDKILLGVDLIKSVDIVLPAYNDKQGITKRFNLNVLERINRELEGDFNLDEFDHLPEYTVVEGIAKSYLVSKIDQIVTIDSLNKSFVFKKGEKIHTEISRKYNDDIINNILKDSQLKLITRLTDCKHYFADYILEKV
ncbi:L-histidine N(alpha)-methyltransferase [Psychroserpens jangbogonensis]|uniref:L-histidine N(alpha)-methyltransferase n=1 Tax=Psychroserpens jangbogonensis TaxID=1484460 RepID=UPI00053F1C0E|nr:L-histidine N(alpha)-methyltransferase [Psychroserpens jangbogonensis]